MLKKAFIIVCTIWIWGGFISCKPNVKEQEEIVYKPIIDSSNSDDLYESDNEPDRVIWQKPEMVIELLGDMHDKVVADIGAGTGFFTFRLLQKAKKVIAVDIDKAPLEKMRTLSQKLDTSISNKLVIKLGTASDPKLSPDKVDIVFLSNTYMYITNRTAYLKNLRKYLNPGARILIIDYKKKNIPFGPALSEKVDLTQVEKELTDAGYKIQKSDDVSLDYQYIVLAKVK